MIRSVLIADDEPNAREYLTRLIGKRSDLKLLGALNNGQEVLNFCRTLKPDVLILDIEMPGVNGLDAAKLLTQKQSQSQIIFSTAYDQYAIAAFDVAAIGYLLKPFSEGQLNQALDRAIAQLNTQDQASFSARIQQIWDKLEKRPNIYLTEFEIKERGLIRKVKTDDIILLEADSEYVKIHTNHAVLLQRMALSTIEYQLSPEFHRIHRGIILNSNFIKSHKYLSDNRFEFTMTNQVQVTSSRSYKDSINEWLTN